MNRLLIVFFTLIASIAVAQPKFETGVTFTSGFPQNEFSQNVDNTGFGVTWDFYYGISHSPFSVGASMGFLTYGSRTRPAVLAPGVVVDANTSNNILLTNFILRYQPPISNHAVRPYLDGVFGFNYLWTQTSLGGGSDQVTSTNFSDTAMTYGAGGGVSFRLFQAGIPNGPPVFRMDLNFGIHYLFGGEAQYLNKGAIHTENGNVFYEVNRSRTDLLVTDVGVGFSF